MFNLLQRKFNRICICFAIFIVISIFISNASFAAEITFDVSKGEVALIDSKYTGKDSAGNTVTGTHEESNRYIIMQSDSDTKTTNRIYIGTKSKAATKNFVVTLAGVNIRRSTEDACALVVFNTGDSEVIIILQDGTNNYLYSGKNRAGLEKGGGTANDGTLVITCEKGYKAYLNDKNKGHIGSDGFSGCNSTCGHLNAKSGNAWTGTSAQTFNAGAGIGTAGSGSGGSTKAGTVAGSNALINLTIAGGRIYATGAWGTGSSSLDIENRTSGGGAGIGTGAASSTTGTGGTITGLKIIGGTIKAYRGDCSAACIGGGYRAGYVNIEIYGGTVLTTESSSKIGDVIDAIRAPAIGGGGGGTQTSSPAGATVTIYNGRIEAYGQYGAAIGSGAGGEDGNGKPAIVNIYGGKVTATTEKASGNGAGAAIGTGGSLGVGYGGAATINIYGGTISATSEYGADIGGGGTNSSSTDGAGGKGIINISGGTITATTGGIGGGKANSGIGGDAEVTISGGNITASNIGGGKSVAGKGGTATVDVSGNAVVVLNEGIGGGYSQKANGGNANINVSGGSLTCNGSIGGGDSKTKTGGTATVIVTGGYLKSKSIGGGNSTSGSGGAADIHISDGIIKTGSIGGGITESSSKSMGYATALIEGGDVSGQFIMAKGTNTPCTFTMTGGILHDSNTSDTEFIHLQKNGGALYMDDPTGIAKISGGTIENCSAENGGAIFINGGNFELLGDGIIKDSLAKNGGAVYVSGGDVTINGGKILSSKAKNGGGIYISNGNILMNGGIIQNNQAEEHGGGIYASSDTQDLTVTITSGSIIGNIASINGGGVGVNIDNEYAATITVGLKECMGLDDTHSHPIVKDNTANQNGGGFWTNGDNLIMNMYCGFIIDNIALLEEGSSNIYQTGGLTTVYAGEVGEGVMVIGGKYDYVPDSDAPEITIIYNSNIPDNIEIKEALVTVGVEIFLPEKLFIRDGYNLVGWSYSAAPTEDDEIFYTGNPYLVPDTDKTVYAVWRIIGAGEIVTPVIKAGKYYDSIIGGTNILITSNSVYTTEMTVNDMKPSLYSNRVISFDRNLPIGTKILMIDKTNTENRKFYYYVFENDNISSVDLTNFKNNITNINYSNLTGDTEINESYIFVVELPINSNILGPTQMILTRKAVNAKTTADIDQKLSFTTTEKREFDFTYEVIDSDNDNKNTINDSIKLSYSKTTPSGEDIRYSGKNLSLVITGNIPEDTKIIIESEEYIQNADSKFVIPFGTVVENIEKEIKLVSDTILENENDILLNASLYSTSDVNNPYLYEKITEIENINLSPVLNPAINLNMSGRVKYADEMEDNIVLSYETVNIDPSYDITLSVQKKNTDAEYEINPSLVQSVLGGTNLGDGKYKLNLSDSGKIKITFLDNLILEEGTYRVYLEVKQDDEVILKVPYNFIILEREEL